MSKKLYKAAIVAGHAKRMDTRGSKYGDQQEAVQLEQWAHEQDDEITPRGTNVKKMDPSMMAFLYLLKGREDSSKKAENEK